MTGIDIRIKENLEDFNATERRIADYVAAHPRDILRLSIAQLARQSGVSQAAIVRFCKRLGFDGLKDIKLSLADDLLSAKESKDDGYSDIRDEGDSGKIVQKVAADHILAIEETVKMLNREEFQRAVELLSAARRIDVFGIGASGLVAQDMQQKLTRIGKFCVCCPDSHMQLTAAASLAEGDAAVLISYSGKTREVVACAEAAGERGSKIIAITKIGQSPLSKKSDAVLNVCSPEIAVRSGATSSRIAQLAVVDMLFTNVASLHYDTSQAILKRSHAYIAANKY